MTAPSHERAALSRGSSDEAILRRVAAVTRRRAPAGLLLDVGCGVGALRAHLPERAGDYLGVDLVRYQGLDRAAPFAQADLDAADWGVGAAIAAATIAVETIEHLENPRAFMRGLVRATRAGGLVVVTTPNQLSLASKLALVARNCFVAFQDAPGLYPAHRTALLEIDLRRIARECGLIDIEIDWTQRGRIPLTRRHWPAGLGGRAFSDHVVLSARRPGA